MTADDSRVRAKLRASERRARDEAPTLPPAEATATRYEVSCLPVGHPERGMWSVTVEYRGRGRWAVIRRGHWCLSVDGDWDYESIPSERTDEWLAAHRFPLEEALRLAKEAAPLATVSGFTVADVLGRSDEGAGR